MSFTLSRTLLPPDHPGPIAIAVHGDGTAWGAGTAFGLTGTIPAGASILDQWIVGPTLATVVMATGPGLGAFGLTDGTDSATLTVRRGVRLGTRGWLPPPVQRDARP